MKITAALLTILFFSACSHKIAPPSTEVKDSTSISERTIYRDSIVTLPGDTITVVLTPPCPEQPKIIRHGNHSTISIETKAGQTIIKSSCDSLQVRLQNVTHERDVLKMKQSKSTTIIKEKFIPLLVKILAWIGAFALVATGLYIFFKLKT